MSKARRIIYIVLGTLFLLLGAAGIFLPLLPTTPFWLLTCWFYLRSSRRLYEMVMRNRYFGPYIRGFIEDKAIPLHSKIISVGVIWLSALLTSFFLLDNIWIIICLLLISAGVSYHILSYPTKK